MANSTLNIAELNPVKFYSETITYPDNYRSRSIDDFSFKNQIRNYQSPARYSQKWMPDDVIHLQFETDFTDIKVELVGPYDIVYKTVVPEIVSSAIIHSPLVFMNVSITLTDIDPGDYFLRIVVTVDSGFKNYISEPFEVSEVVENSVLFHYSNETNDYDVAFDTGIVFQFRSEGGLTNFVPDAKSKVYEDQNLNSVRLSSFPFRSYKLVIGGAEGVPDWIADKVNRILSCNYTTIDGAQFVRADGAKMEPVREENYPMAAWSVDIREATNNRTKQFKTFILYGVLDYDGAVLVDYDNRALQSE